jgi:hypothetical protein
MGMVLWLLSGFASGRIPERHRRLVRSGPRRFEAAWRVFLANRTEADFEAYREARDWHQRKYAMWERGERMPSQKPSSLMTCPCGEVFDSHRLEHTMVHVPHITAAQA